MAHDILIVDDEEDIRSLIAGILEDEGYTTRAAGSSQQALSEVAARRPTLVILDIWMEASEHDGIETLKEADFLTRMGADCLQGYYFGVPKFDIS